MMAAMLGKPVDIFVVWAFLCCFCCKSAVTAIEDKFTEELYIRSLYKGHVLNHFQFTTLWNSSVSDENACKGSFQNVQAFSFSVVFEKQKSALTKY